MLDHLNSPEYHIYGLQQRQDTLEFLNSWHISDNLSTYLSNAIERMTPFVEHIVKPNGELVQVGDTRKVHIIEYKEQLSKLEKNPKIISDLINDESTKNQTPYQKAYLDEGYAIIRNTDNDRNTFENSFYLFFTAAANKGRGHYQSDHLSFTLSNLGTELLIDPGYFSYKEGKGRSYAVSPAAHNSISIQGQSYKGWDTSLDHFFSTKDFSVIQGSHRNYSETEHKRWIFLKSEEIVVVDILLSEKDTINQYQQLFNLAPNLSAHKQTTSEIAVKNGNQTVMIIESLTPKEESTHLYKGNDAPMLGRHSFEHAKLTPTTTVSVNKKGRNSLYVTRIWVPSKMGQKPPKSSINLETVNSSVFLLKTTNNDRAINFLINTNEGSFKQTQAGIQ